MFRIRDLTAAGLALLAANAALFLAGCGPAGVNGSVEVAAGSTAEGATTINGSVTVGDGAKVGEAATVNGGVRLGANVTAQSARTVNGGIDIGSGTRIAQDVEAVNGAIRLDKGADIAGGIRNVNGAIQLNGAHVAKGITTYTGDVEVARGSHVEGGIHVEKPDFSNDSQKHIPRIVIGAESVVDGTLKFDRDVKLLVSDSAKIGPVEGATPRMFSGDDPNNLIEPASAAPASDATAEKAAEKPAQGK